METIRVKSSLSALLPTFLFLLLQCPSPVRGEPQPPEACFYNYPWRCTGSAACCTFLDPDDCCDNNLEPEFGLSASVVPMYTTDPFAVYQSHLCQDAAIQGVGRGCVAGQCVVSFGSAAWSLHDSDRAEQGTGREKTCNRTVSPDTLKYTFITEERKRASWVLPMVDVSKADLTNLSADQQVDWFKSHGATLEVDDHEMDPADVPGSNQDETC